ncbi:alpha/beta hydrolase [Massilia endophytica]|uniref:alpha/beta hydrolase n=1 Tax=Massilia endophytica TaxID=2899220 RepID=UPI001E472F7C|nr:alpha/beta hydrolase [Massilia endophytica]UGQ44643.1 alpha/beta hydrolase [Massilia endophytica]
MRHLLLAAVLAGSVIPAHAGYPNEVLTAPSHRAGLKLGIRHKHGAVKAGRDPVLFVHGSSFPSALAFDFQMAGGSWMDQLAEQGFDVYALDFTGYGLSDRYPEMSSGAAYPVGRAKDVAGDVDAAVDLILRRTGKRRVLLIGHSWGGSVAARYAGLHPEKVSKLVLFAAITARSGTAPAAQVQSAYEELTPEQRIAGMNGLAPVEARPQLAPEVLSRWGAQWLASDTAGINGGKDRVRFPSGPSQDIEDLSHGRSYYDPAAIRAPVLLIRGEWDAYPTHEDYLALLSGLGNAASRDYRVVPKGTHVAHLEAARHDLYREVLRFLTDDSVSTSGAREEIGTRTRP